MSISCQSAVHVGPIRSDSPHTTHSGCTFLGVSLREAQDEGSHTDYDRLEFYTWLRNGAKRDG